MTELGLTAEQCNTLILELRAEKGSTKNPKGRSKNRKGKGRVTVGDDEGDDEDEELDELNEDDEDTVESEDDIAQPSATIPPIRIPFRGSTIGRDHQPRTPANETIVRKKTPLFLPSDDEDDQPVPHVKAIGEDESHAESRPTTPPLSLHEDKDVDDVHEVLQGQTGTSYLICATYN